jgi:hypothetical protein
MEYSSIALTLVAVLFLLLFLFFHFSCRLLISSSIKLNQCWGCGVGACFGRWGCGVGACFGPTGVGITAGGNGG